MASNTIGSLLIEMGADVASLRKDMDVAKQTVTGTMRDIAGAAKTFAGALGVALSAAGFVYLIKGSIDAADHLEKLSKSTNISVEDLAGLSLLAKQTGTDLDGLAKGINKMSVAMGKDEEKFRALGITAKDNKGAFQQFADIFNLLTDVQQRNALAQSVFGKSWAEMAPALSEGGKKIGEIIERGAKLSSVTEEMTQQAHALNNKWVELTGTGGLLTQMVGPMLPLLNSLADDMLKAQEKTEGLKSSFSPLAESLKAVIVLGANMSFVFQTVGKDMARAFENVKLIASGDFAGSRALGEMFKKDAAAAREALDAYEKKVMELGLTGTAASGAPPPDPAEAAAAAAKAAAFLAAGKNQAAEAAELKLFISTLQSLEKEYAHLTGMRKVVLIQWEMEKGSIRGLTAEHKKEVLAQAEVNEAYLIGVQLREENVSARTAELALVKANQDAIAGIVIAYSAERDALAFQASLIGVSAREQEKMNAVRQIELDLRQRIAQLPKIEEGNTEALRDQTETIARQRAEAEEQKKFVRTQIGDRQSAERDWLTGVKSGMDEYIGEVTNAAAMSKKLFHDAFKGMEDALVNFVKTGKLDFKSLADSIITDIIRINIQQSITGPLAAASGDFFKSIGSSLFDAGVSFFGGGLAAGGDVDPGHAYLVGEHGPEMLLTGESGGTVVPNEMMQSGGDTYYIDARGADRTGLAQLTAAIRAVNGSIEHRAVGAVRRAFNQRGVSTALG